MARKGSYPESVQSGIPRLGRKPQGWQKVHFGDVLEMVERKADLEDDKVYQLVTVKRSRGGVFPREILRGDQILTKTQFYINQGDFLISKRQIVHGACGVVPKELDRSVVSNEYAALTPKNGVSLDYVKHFSNSIYFQQTCFHSSIGVHVEKMIFNVERWFNFQFYLPPFSEQQRISKILDDYDRAIYLASTLLNKVMILKQGLMQKLLPGKKRFSEFKRQVWQEYYLKDLFEERKEENRTDLTLLSVTSDKGVIYRDELDKKDTSSGDKSKYKRIAPGDIGYNTMRMWQGVSALAEKEGIVSPAYTICIPNSKIDGHFAKHLFKFRPMVHTFWRRSQGLVSDTLNLKFHSFAQIKVRIPGIEEQKRIAAVLNVVDKEIGLLNNKLTTLQDQKKGLMQKLLTGKLRVKV